MRTRSTLVLPLLVLGIVAVGPQPVRAEEPDLAADVTGQTVRVTLREGGRTMTRIGTAEGVSRDELRLRTGDVVRTIPLANLSMLEVRPEREHRSTATRGLIGAAAGAGVGAFLMHDSNQSDVLKGEVILVSSLVGFAASRVAPRPEWEVVPFPVDPRWIHTSREPLVGRTVRVRAMGSGELFSGRVVKVEPGRMQLYRAGVTYSVDMSRIELIEVKNFSLGMTLGGTLLGGAAGGFVGIFVGAGIADALEPEDSWAPLYGGMYGFLGGTLIGAAIGSRAGTTWKKVAEGGTVQNTKFAVVPASTREVWVSASGSF